MNKLNHHLRQYRHNNSDGFVAGYEQEGTEVFVSCLEQEIAELKAMVNALRESLASITKEENIHPIKDWVICGICTNSSSGSEGRKTRFEKFDKFFALINKADATVDNTPTQCLASVKADAVEEMINSIKSTARNETVFLASIWHYSDKLREQK